MWTSRATLSQLLAVGILLALATQSPAQILPAPADPPSQEIRQAGGGLAAAEEARAGVQQTSWPKVTLPKITMPTFTMPKMTMPDMSQMFSPISAGFQKVSAGSKKAWEGTKEMFTFGSGSDDSFGAATRAPPKPSIWQRLISRSPEPAAPQTVGEWMSQPRIEH